MGGERPTAVTAVTQRIKPEIYPERRRRGDDRRRVSRRAGHHRRRRGTGRSSARTWRSTPSAPTPSPPAATACACGSRRAGDHGRARCVPLDERTRSATRGGRRGRVTPAGLSSLANNMVVVEILDAARIPRRPASASRFRARLTANSHRDRMASAISKPSSSTSGVRRQARPGAARDLAPGGRHRVR